MPDAPVQHTPVHLEGDVFDPRHPAASAFAPLQPAAGVVADDVEEKGQNLRGGPTATAANKTHSDQKEKLQEQHVASLKTGVTGTAAATVDGDTAKPADTAKSATKATGTTKK